MALLHFASILKQTCAGDCSWWNHVEPIEGGQYSQYWLEYDLNIISFYPRKLDGWIRRHVRFSGSRAYPTVTHSIPQSCLATRWRPSPTGMTWRIFYSPGITWHLHQCYSPMAESWGLKHVEDLLTSNCIYIYISYGYSWMWMEDDEPHCSFQSLSLRHGVTWNRYIWGKDGPCSTWPSLDSLQTGTVQPVQQPFRGWIQVFSPNHPPKKVLAAGYQW